MKGKEIARTWRTGQQKTRQFVSGEAGCVDRGVIGGPGSFCRGRGGLCKIVEKRARDWRGMFGV